MSTDEMEKKRIEEELQINEQIQSLLGSLGDESLKRSRNSVKLSFTQMLGYIDEIRKSIPDGDIKLLLKTYREMAVKFYTQYELSLIKDITKHSDDQIQFMRVIADIGKLPEDDPKEKNLKLVLPLLEKANKAAAVEYNNLTETFPKLLQNALDKLKDEWQRLDTIAVASKTLTEDKNLIQTLKVVVFSAALSVGIEAERIAVVPGDAFALYFFTYLENFAVLTVPIYSVQAPWEWSIFWHELAGFKVRQLEKDTALTAIRENLERLHNLFKTLDETGYSKADLLPSISPNNPFGLKYISKLFSSEDKLDLSDLGSFEHQFERMLANLQIENKFQNYEQIKAEGWCVDWFKELFEDAWSVLAIGKDFLPYFEDILSRHDVTDGRHPPLEVRLSVARELLKLGEADLESKVENQPKLVETIAAEQILKFMSLIIMASSCTSYTFEKLEELITLLWFDRGMIGDFVGEKLKAAISDWSTKFLAADDSAGKVKDYAKDFIEGFAKDPELPDWIQRIEKKDIVSSYEILLDGQDYKQLLELSFYERDFFNFSGTNANVTVYKLEGKAWKVKHQNITSTKIINNIKGTTGSVRFKVDSKDYYTTPTNWTTLFPEYPIS